MRQFYVYILFNQSRTLYIGVTNDLLRRTYEHQHKLVPGFTSRYNVNQLAYFEIYATASSAIEREKQLKGWTRAKKIALIERLNPRWDDLIPTLHERFDAPENPLPPTSTQPQVPGQILRCAQDDGLRPSDYLS
jgi:putative endonuclease